jgi:putative addiction module component (TIGR02574 family)
MSRSEARSMNKVLREELMKLTPAERIELAMDLWDSIPPNSDNWLPLTDEQKAELDRRLAEHERNPSRARPWEEVQARLSERFDK